MNKIAMLSTASLCALLASVLSSDVSLASAPACTGFTRNPADAASFVIADGCAALNVSGATKRWEVSDFITSSGNHTAIVTALRPNGGTLSCFACATLKEGFNTGCTASVSLNVVDIDTQFTVGTVNVPGFGGLYVACDMSPGAWYDSVNF
jgi:hypothetical protein